MIFGKVINILIVTTILATLIGIPAYLYFKDDRVCLRGFEEERLVENAEKVGDHAFRRMTEMMTRHRLIGDVRGLGLLMGMELVRDIGTKERASEEAERVMYEALDRGLSFKVSMGNIITLTPALTITAEEMDRALNILDECLTEVERNRDMTNG